MNLTPEKINNRGLSELREMVPSHETPLTVNLEPPTLKQGPKSNDHQELSADYYKCEALRAWKAYLALTAERCIYKIECDIYREMENLDRLSSPHFHKSLMGIGRYQSDVILKLDDLEDAKLMAKDQFEANITRLEKGRKFDSLPPIDPKATLKDVEEFVKQHYSIELNLTRSISIPFAPRPQAMYRVDPDSAVPYAEDVGESNVPPTGEKEKVVDQHCLSFNGSSLEIPVSGAIDAIGDVYADVDDGVGAVALSPDDMGYAEEILDLLKPIGDQGTGTTGPSLLACKMGTESNMAVQVDADLLSVLMADTDSNSLHSSSSVRIEPISYTQLLLPNMSVQYEATSSGGEDSLQPPRSDMLSLPNTATEKHPPISIAEMGSSGTSTEVISFGTCAEVLSFGTSAEVLSFGTSTDVISFGTSTEVISSGTSAEVISPDVITIMVLPDASMEVLSSGTSTDVISSGTSTEVISFGTSAEGISFGTVAEVISFGTSAEVLSSSTSAEVLSFGTSAEVISSGTSAEVLSFGTSAEVISSGTSTEVISSGTSAEVISSGTSAEILSSGTSAEVLSSGTIMVSPDASNASMEVLSPTSTCTELLSSPSTSIEMLLDPSIVTIVRSSSKALNSSRMVASNIYHSDDKCAGTTIAQDSTEKPEKSKMLDQVHVGVRSSPNISPLLENLDDISFSTEGEWTTVKRKRVQSESRIEEHPAHDSQAAAARKTKKGQVSAIPKADTPASYPMDNVLFQGEEGKKRRHITMCRAYQKGECRWGSLCNYSHSKEDLLAARQRLEKSTKKLSNDHSREGEVSSERVVEVKKWSMCKGFELGLCMFPSRKCKYAHSVDELDKSVQHAEPCRKQQCPNRLKYEKRKTTMCPVGIRGRCMFGADCMYAHKVSELRKLPKHELCSRFGGGANCVKASECVYAHSRSELRPPSPVREKPKTENNTMTAAVNKPSTKSSTKPAPANTSKAGSVEKKTKPSTTSKSANKKAKAAGHTEPCYKQFCPERLRYETRRTRMCSYALKHIRCPEEVICYWAHSKSELRPMPKYEMCSMYWGCGRCLPVNECPYAHKRTELRVRPTAKESSTKKGSTHAEPCNEQQCSGRQMYERRWTTMCDDMIGGSCQLAGVCYKAHFTAQLRPLPKHEMCIRYKKTGKCLKSSECVFAHSESELRSSDLDFPTSLSASVGASASNFSAEGATSLDEECVICYGRLDERIDLDCGHDRFHFRCISKWLNEGRPYCPLCNQSAMLPDLFDAPAGLKSSDFPVLSRLL